MREKTAFLWQGLFSIKPYVAVINPYLHSLIIYPLNAAFPFFCIALCWGLQCYLDHQQHPWELFWDALRWVKPDSFSVLGLLSLVSLSKTRQLQERLRRGSQTALFFSVRKEIFLPILQPLQQTKCVFYIWLFSASPDPSDWRSHNPSPTLFLSSNDWQCCPEHGRYKTAHL